MRDRDMPAWPQPGYRNLSNGKHYPPETGLTKREFAAIHLAAAWRTIADQFLDYDLISERAIKDTDAVFDELEKGVEIDAHPVEEEKST